MNLNLIIRDLEILENFAHQKCLIPVEKFPSVLKPGCWCKCYRGNDGDYSVCQIFPRSNISLNCCFLDDVVCRTNENFGNSENLLTRIEVLSNDIWPNNENNDPAERLQITLSFEVTENLFLHNFNKISLGYLLQCSLQYLPTLHLIQGCKVKLKHMKKSGIAAIIIDEVKGALGTNSLVCIDEDSRLIVNNVRLLRSNETQQQTFEECGFESAREELRNMLLFSEMLRRHSWQIRPSLNALITGELGCGKSALIRWFLNEYHCNSFYIQLTNVLGQYPGETEEQLRHTFLAAKTFVEELLPKSPTVIVIEDLQVLCPVLKITSSDSANKSRILTQFLKLIDDLYKENVNIICLATSSSPQLINEFVRRPRRFEREIFIPKPTEQQRKNIFSVLFDQDFYTRSYKCQLTTDLVDVVGKQTQGFVFSDLDLLVRNVSQRLLRCSSNENIEHILQQALKQAKPASIQRTEISVYKPLQGFECVGGMDTLKRTLELSIMRNFKHSAAYKRFGLNIPKGILLYGPPGCAKTTIAKCIAKEADMMFLAASSAEIYSPFVGCAEKFIIKLFDTARKHLPCIIFLDEIDSLVGCRNNGSNSDQQLRVLSTLLTEMDGVGVNNIWDTNCTATSNILIIAATNRPDLLDNALLRPGRFDKLIHVPAPDFEGRCSILKLHAKHMPFSDDVDLQVIANLTSLYSGADICNLCNEAALNALQNDFDSNDIRMKDFNYVLSHHKRSLSPEQIDWYLNFEEKLTT